MIVRSVDLETTGIPSETDRQAIVEIGWTDITRVGDQWKVGYPKSMLVNPGRSIPPEVSAIHHIRDVDVADKPDPGSAMLAFGRDCEAAGVTAYAAHNLDFEQNWFNGGGKPMVCSFKAALRIWKDAPEHGNQTLRYFLGFDDFDDFEPALAMPPHRAAPDSYVTAFLVAEILDQVDFDTWVKWSKGPALLITCWLNKHRGKLWSEVARVDRDYLNWIVRDVTDRNIRATAKYWLKQTEKPAGQPAADGQVKI